MMKWEKQKLKGHGRNEELKGCIPVHQHDPLIFGDWNYCLGNNVLSFC